MTRLTLFLQLLGSTHELIKHICGEHFVSVLKAQGSLPPGDPLLRPPGPPCLSECTRSTIYGLLYPCSMLITRDAAACSTVGRYAAVVTRVKG